MTVLYSPLLDMSGNLRTNFKIQNHQAQSKAVKIIGYKEE